MKKSMIVVSVLLCSVLLAGCGKTQKDGIVGTWESETGSYKYTFKEDGTCTQNVLGTSSDCTYDSDRIIKVKEYLNAL